MSNEEKRRMSIKKTSNVQCPMSNEEKRRCPMSNDERRLVKLELTRSSFFVCRFRPSFYVRRLSFFVLRLSFDVCRSSLDKNIINFSKAIPLGILYLCRCRKRPQLNQIK